MDLKGPKTWIYRKQKLSVKNLNDTVDEKRLMIVDFIDKSNTAYLKKGH